MDVEVQERTDLTRSHEVVEIALQNAGFKIEKVQPGALDETKGINEPVIWGIESPDGTSLSLTMNVTP